MIGVIGFLVGMLMLVVSGVEAKTIFVSKAGSDGNSCIQAETLATAKLSFNAGIGCLVGGDTLVIGSGTYDELLYGDLSLIPPTGYTTVQPGGKVIPNGTISALTTIKGAPGAAVVLTAIGREFPGGGGIITMGTNSAYVKFEGLTLVQSSNSGSACGIVLTNGLGHQIINNDITCVNGFSAGLSGSSGSSNIIIRGNVIHNIGDTTCTFPSHSGGSPCPHGIYLCGDDHLIEQNVIHHCGHSGIQVSCESGGITNVTIRRNVIKDVPGSGVRIGCTGCKVYGNVMVRNGTGVNASGSSNTISNNTIYDYFHSGLVPDAYGVLYDTGGVIVNNLIFNAMSSFHQIDNRSTAPIDTGNVHHNMCALTGNTGCTLISTAGSNFVSIASEDFHLLSTAPARGAAVVVSGVDMDYDGVAMNSPPDIGGYQFTTSTPPVEPIAVVIGRGMFFMW